MRIEKQSIINEMREQLEKSPFVVATDYNGMRVAQFDILRRRLAKHGAEFHVVQKRLWQRAADGLPSAEVATRAEGPLAIAVGGDGFEALREIKKFFDEHKRPAIQCGFFEGRFFAAPEIAELVNLPTRDVLYGMLAGTLAAPMSRLAGVMRQKLASIVYVLKAVQEKKDQPQ